MAPLLPPLANPARARLTRASFPHADAFEPTHTANMNVVRPRGRLACVVAVAVSLIASGCGADEPAGLHNASQVTAAFGEAGLPVDRDEATFEVVPDGATRPQAVFTARSGGGFYVIVYGSVEDAAQVVTSAPEVDPVFRQRRSFSRNGNVVAVVQPPSPALTRKVETALSSL